MAGIVDDVWDDKFLFVRLYIRKGNSVMMPYVYIILPSYAVLAFLGIFITLIFLYFHKDQYHVPFNDFLFLFCSCIIGGFIGSKLLYVFSQLPILGTDFSFVELPRLFLHSGYVFYGGLFGVLTTLYIVVVYRGHNTVDEMYQMIAPSLPLFHGFGRIGCMMAGCCYGITLENPVVLFNMVQINLFPTQLIESVYEFSLFVLIYWIGKHYPKVDLLRLYLVSYAVFRFCIEFVRADNDRGMWLMLSTSQWISIVILVYFCVWPLVKQKFCQHFF